MKEVMRIDANGNIGFPTQPTVLEKERAQMYDVLYDIPLCDYKQFIREWEMRPNSDRGSTPPSDTKLMQFVALNNRRITGFTDYYKASNLMNALFRHIVVDFQKLEL